MKIFGKGKKSDRDEDSGRLALFGSRSKNKSPPNNPYAQPAAPPDPYTQAKMDAGIIPPTQQTVGSRLPPGSGMGLPSGPSMKNGYGDVNHSRYSPNQDGNDQKFGAPSAGHGIADGYRDDKYGNPGGYGQGKFGGNTYGAGMPAAAGLGYGPDGYGGLGRSKSIETTNTDANRNELFGDASQRMPQRGVNAYENPPPYGTDPGQGSSSMAYGDRQMTAEEEEEEDIEATKQEIRYLKQQGVSSTKHTLNVLAEAEETGRNTLARLGVQGERFHYTERNLDLAMAEQDTAEDLTKKLGRGIIHVNNPFTRGQGEKILQVHQKQRMQQEATRKAAFNSTQGMIGHFKDIEASSTTLQQKQQSNLAERAKFQFEADSEDDEMERQIEDNLGKIGEKTDLLNRLAKAQGRELEEQNELLKRIDGKGNVLDERLVINSHKLYKAGR